MTDPAATDTPANDFPIPTLMRAARGAYARAIRAQLHALGIDGLPRNGVPVLFGIDNGGWPHQDLPGDLGVTKQAVSQLIDTLVSRGYVERRSDPDDRRRIAPELTARGQEALEAAIRAVDAVDEQLRERVSAGQIEAARAVLLALAQIKSGSVADGTGLRRPARELRSFSPIFPVRDLAAALAHYASLGFVTYPHADGDEYGFADRDGVSLHLAREHGHGHDTDDGHDHDPDGGHDHDGSHGQHSAAAYLYVRDAAAVYEQWSQPGIGGRTSRPEPTPYQLLEGSHVDPDGNLLRFGSPLED